MDRRQRHTSKQPIKKSSDSFLEIIFLHYFNTWISLLLYKTFNSTTPFLLPDLLFYSWRLFNKVANRGRKINKKHTPAHYCLLLPPIKYFFMVKTESTVACAASFLISYSIKCKYLSIEQCINSLSGSKYELLIEPSYTF